MGTIKCFGFPQPHGLLLEERHSPERTACRAWHSQRLALSEVKEQPWQQNGDCLVGWEASSPPPKQTLHGAGWGEVVCGAASRGCLAANDSLCHSVLL